MSNAIAVSASVAHRRPAGWYPDEDEPTLRRWWDGVAWTEYWAPATQPHPVLVEKAQDAAEPYEPQVIMIFKPTAPVWVATVLVTANAILFGMLTH
jgi:Protein of unknown function (DUF2510)